MRAGLLAAVAALAAALATSLALALPASSLALPKLYECQHPMITGQEAYHLVDVSPATACKTVRELAAFVHNGAKGYKLYRCAGLGKPVLVISQLDGWKLQISRRYGLVMSRGGSLFAVTGTDFPLNCT
ncbi:MAG TPA: hypothetical protein VN740_07185 [Solirubrobacteraceae bacterium]|nr:hypothetical protein [Solirubrobacteraceae bacterium]